MPARVYRWSEIPHLARRAVWSLCPPAPSREREAWLLALLSTAEAELYTSMNQLDRAHAINCAEAVRDHPTEVVVASALHDVGKTAADLGTAGRVVASLAGLTVADRARSWAGRAGLRGQIARYLEHPQRGAERLREAGASELAVTWAAEHHLAPSERSLAPDMWQLLHEADEAAG